MPEAATTTAPTDAEIMDVLGLTSTSTEQLCQRLRDLFGGIDAAQGKDNWLLVLRHWANSDEARPLDFRGSEVPTRIQTLLAQANHAGKPAIEEYQAEIREINEANGWFEGERSFGDDIALLHSEVSEMYEAYREWEFEDATAQAVASITGEVALPKPEGVGSECADVLVRLLDTCERHGIDLRWELERKLEHNRTRGHRHGGKLV